MTGKELALEAALAGLDFLVRHQVVPNTQNSDLLTYDSADLGRFPLIYNIREDKCSLLSCSWVNGVIVEAMLSGYNYVRRSQYLKAAELGIKYIKSLQAFVPFAPRLNGVIREWTPQTDWAHPRDALTAAWALLDWYSHTGDESGLVRAKSYADWFITVGMEKEYPYWTVRFDEKPWEPTWHGSFHSGGAFFFYRLFDITGRVAYKLSMLKILDYYNHYHLGVNGSIAVIIDAETHERLDGKFGLPYTCRQWEIMHKFNDDFGALANLAAYRITGSSSYRNAAVRFLKRMLDSQRCDGGFGPVGYAVPSAAGTVAIELLAAKKLGLEITGNDEIEAAMTYLLGIQVHNKDCLGYGAFLDDDNEANARTCAYAVMALLRWAGAIDNYYFFES